jgi:hypothetical protein
MKPWPLEFMAFLAFVFPYSAAGENSVATLEIKVMKRAYGEHAEKPFSGVGVFDLLRGRTRLEGARCPDRSGVTGGVICSIPCQADRHSPVTIRVQPPSDQDSLAGWVTPAPKDIELRGCKLTPRAVTMRYDDAKYALNQLIVIAVAELSPDKRAPSRGDAWIVVLKDDPEIVSKVTAEATSSMKFRVNLLNIYRLASEGTKAYTLPVSQQSSSAILEGQALAKWQLLAKGALLSSQLERTVPALQRNSIKLRPTDDLATYEAYLSEADTLLATIKDKNVEQQKLSDDIKTLRALPATGKEAVDAFAIIQQWQ